MFDNLLTNQLDCTSIKWCPLRNWGTLHMTWGDLSAHVLNMLNSTCWLQLVAANYKVKVNMQAKKHTTSCCNSKLISSIEYVSFSGLGLEAESLCCSRMPVSEFLKACSSE